MRTTFDTLALLAGIAILYWGANWLIRGSAQVARAFGVKPLVVGLTVVAYGASAPELTVATQAALTHHERIALGVVIGSCAANISLILGLTALISPPTIDGRIIRREVPVLLGSVIAVPILFRNGVLSRLEGAVLVMCAVVFTIATLAVSSRLEPDDPLEIEARRTEDNAATLAGKGHPRGSRGTAALQTAIGLILLVAGARLFLDGARGVGKEIGISERMLGLTVISLGTALPELIGSIVAASRGNAALAIGSVIGSNVLNVFLVLGVTAYLRPIHAGELLHVSDLIGLVGITALGILMLRGSRKISRVEGFVLVLAYIAFITTAALL
ncbi:MAG: calcium/sodium antiporter [Deltaproteobacteria bacterium]|nr:MAG: calcium/sodium antiporter [Deltaproteobacteria bacterium]